MEKNNFLEFCKKSGFFIDEFQEKIIENIFQDINNKTLISIIYMPNAAGKTNLSVLLSCYFKQNDKEPLLYSPMGMKYDYEYNPIVAKNKDCFDRIDFFNAADMPRKPEKKYDYIIADSLAYTDINHVDINDVKDFIYSITAEETITINEETEKILEWIGQRKLSKTAVESNAKIIIFMKRVDAELCDRTVFFQSPKKNIVDIYPKCESKTGNETFVSKEQNENYLEQLFRQFYFKLNTIEGKIGQVNSKVEEINKKVNAVYDILQDIQNKVSIQKQTIFALAEIDDDIDTFVEKIIDKLSQQISESILRFEDLDSYKKYEQLVQVRMGDEAWRKLDAESRRFLVTAKFSFSQNVLLGGDDIDYSGICLMASKAFEIELAKRLVEGYTNYLSTILGNNYMKWPSAVIKKQKNGSLRPIEVDEFMLGNCPYLFGILESPMKDREINKKYFEKYCKEVLLKKEKCADLKIIIKGLDKRIRIIKDNFRNPAAHKSSISMLEASECIDYILEIERVMKYMLELFNF